MQIDLNVVMENVKYDILEELEGKIKNEVLEFNIWEKPELDKIITDYYKAILKEVLEENKTNVKSLVEKVLNDELKDEVMTIVSDKLNGYEK